MLLHVQCQSWDDAEPTDRPEETPQSTLNVCYNLMMNARVKRIVSDVSYFVGVLKWLMRCRKFALAKMPWLLYER